MLPRRDLQFPLHVISGDGLNWLLTAGVPAATLERLMPIRTARGLRAADGRFEPDEQGGRFLIFPEQEDTVFWCPRSREIATWRGCAFALGEDAIDCAWTYCLDSALTLFEDPLSWLRANCDGCVVLQWEHAWNRLHHVPRIALSEGVVNQYRRHMKPPRGPQSYVLVPERKTAAA